MTTNVSYLPTRRRVGLGFGDVCKAPFLFDAHLDADAASLSRQLLSAAFARKNGWGDAALPYWVAIGEDENLVLAHGQATEAVCLSDDCLIDTALGRTPGEVRNVRLLFAPIREPQTATEWSGVIDNRPYGLFPLPADTIDGKNRVIALRNSFTVEAAAIHGALPGLVIRSIADEPRGELANRLAAYACRRGPIVDEDNLTKLANVLVAAGADAARAHALGIGLISTAAAAWAFQGRGLERAGQLADEGGEVAPILLELTMLLEKLLTEGQQALKTLESLEAVQLKPRVAPRAS